MFQLDYARIGKYRVFVIVVFMGYFNLVSSTNGNLETSVAHGAQRAYLGPKDPKEKLILSHGIYLLSVEKEYT